MLQNVGMCCTTKKYGLFDRALTSENAYQDGQNIWMTSMKYNALFRLDKREMKLHFVGTFLKENLMEKRLFSSLAMCEGKLYFAPYTAKQIAVYDLDSGEFKSLEVLCACKEVNHLYEKKKFHHMVTVGSKVYFIPAYYPGILCYDVKTKEFRCFDEWVDEVEELKSGERAYFKEYILNGNYLILPCVCANAVVIFDILTGISHIVRMPNTKNILKYSGICQVGKYFWLVTIDGEIFIRKLEAEDEEIRKVVLPKDKSDNIFFYPIRKVRDFVYLFSFGRRGNMIRIHTRTQEIECKDMLGTDLEEVSIWSINVILDKERMYISMDCSNSIMVYDLEGEKVQESSLYLSDADKFFLEEIHSRNFEERISGGYVRETSEESLKFMLNYICNNKSMEKSRMYERLNYGVKLYEAL